jgi:outer membrane protein OmpA-like peptidoglycan-associated protein
VIDKKTNKPLPSAVELIDNSNNNALMKVQTDELGEYFITLPTGKDYTFTVNRKGYLFFSELYALSNKQADSVYKKDIYLQPVELNVVSTFNNILFANNSFELPQAGFIELDKLLQVLTENPTLKVEISGHTDNVGKADDNLKLSTNRAKAIVDYLVSKGIAAARMSYKGYGATQPVADNATEAGRAKNRRTTFTVGIIICDFFSRKGAKKQRRKDVLHNTVSLHFEIPFAPLHSWRLCVKPSARSRTCV